MSDSRSRRVADVKVPARSTGRLRGLAFIGVTALAVLALIVALNTLRPPQEVVPLTSPSASATASVSAAASATLGSAPSATSSPAASAVGVRPDASHGMLTRNPAAIRTEADPTALNRTPNWDEGAAAAVSPDGKRVAVLRSGQTGQGSSRYHGEARRDHERDRHGSTGEFLVDRRYGPPTAPTVCSSALSDQAPSPASSRRRRTRRCVRSTSRREP